MNPDKYCIPACSWEEQEELAIEEAINDARSADARFARGQLALALNSAWKSATDDQRATIRAIADEMHMIVDTTVTFRP